MSDRTETVTDHALVRYLERVYGVNVKALRRRIANKTHTARAIGAGSVKIDGVRYVLSSNGRVVTVHGVKASVSKRGERWKKRRT